MGDHPRRPPLRMRLALRLASLLVPYARRERFLEEWRGELAAANPLPAGLVRGVFADALALRDVERRRYGRRTTMGSGLGGGWSELRQAVRGLVRAPLFAGAAVVTLGLGIGGTTAIFTLVDRVILDPLPYPGADRLVQVKNQVPGVAPDEEWQASTAQFVDFSARARAFDALALYRPDGAILETASGARRATGWAVSHELFPLLGARARTGRLFSADDDRPGAPILFVLSDGFWRRQFGADPGIVGRTVTAHGQAVEVVGVLEPGFRMPDQPPGTAADLYLPLRADRAGGFQNNHVYRLVGRLAPGVDPAAADRELAALTADLPERFPDVYSETFFERYGFRTFVRPLGEVVVGADLVRNLWLLLGAVGLVMLVAATNAANLFVVRMEGRRQEMAVRRALGAGRVALARHLVSEALVLALAGAALGVVLAWFGTPAVLALTPEGLPRMDAVRLDGAGVAFALVLALALALALAAYPLVGDLRSDAGAASSGARTVAADRERQRFRSALVVTQVALALTLVAGSALLLKSVRALGAVDPGFEPEGVLVLSLDLDPTRYRASGEMWHTYDGILEGLRALPGVRAAGMAASTPLSGEFGCTVQGFDEPAVFERIAEAGLTTCAGQTPTAPGYFEAMDIPILQGRGFTDGDNDDPGRAAVVVSRAFADRFWPGEDPLGKGVAPSGRTTGPFYRVVGVAGDVPEARLDGDRAIAIYYPIVEDPNTPGRWGWWPTSQTLVVRTAGVEPTSLLPAIRRVVDEVDPGAPLADARTMESVVAASMGRLTFVSALLALAATVALLLAAVGLYGVIAWLVARRTREIGLRMALGARAEQVRRMVVGRALAMVAAGLVVGLALTVATSRLLESLLYGVAPADPVALAAAALVLTAVAFAAAWIPARRAARVDPSEALRAE